MKKIIFLLSLFAVINTASAQKWADKVNPWGGINGIQYSIGAVNNFEVGLNYVISSYPKENPGLAALAGFQNISIGIGVNENSKTFYFGPHAAYQVALAILDLQASIDYRTTLKDHYFRVSPKVGLSFFGFFNVVAGYNIILNRNDRIDNKSPYNITIQLTILNH